MSTHRNIDKICVVITVLCLLLTVVFMFGERLGIEKIVDEDAEVHSDSAWFTSNDCNADWDASNATVITLNGSEASVSGKGAYAYDGGVVISNGGYYVLSGSLTDGSVTVDAYNSSKVWLLLDGVDISCSDDACLRVDQADKVFLTLAEGSENSLTSGESYSDTALSDGTDGAIFAHDDLTINGSGSLTVTAAYRHGIVGNDDLVITGGVISVSAPVDGIRANDSLRIREATITIDAGDDGLVADNEGAYLYIESGSIDLTAGGDAIHTAGDITIDGGSLTIAAGDDGIHSDTAFLMNAGTVDISESYEGIEAITIEQTGGDITIHATDDGLNANGGNGSMFGGMGVGGGFPQNAATQENTQSAAEAGDTQSAADIQSSEASTPPDGESGEMTSPPDGESGEMASPPDGAMQTQSTDGSDEETWIRMSGGSLTILNENGRDADGLDSNGSIYISGGTVRVSLLGDGSNSALDYASESGGVAEISGGTLIACGGSSMAERFDSGSTQASFLYTNAQASADGSTLTLTDADGNEILSWTVPYRFTAALVSAPEMAVGETYTLAIGDSIEELTLTETAGSFGDGASGMMGGMMGGMADGEMPEMGEMPDGEPPELPDGEMPEMTDGERPTPPDGEIPTSPDGQSGGFGGKGGFGGQRPDMSQIADGEMPEFADGERPMRPGGQRPDMGQTADGEMPTPSEGEAAQAEDGAPTPPDGEASQSEGEMPTSPEGMAELNSLSDTQQSTQADEASESAASVSGRTWLLLGVCALALLMAILIAKKYRRHG